MGSTSRLHEVELKHDLNYHDTRRPAVHDDTAAALVPPSAATYSIYLPHGM